MSTPGETIAKTSAAAASLAGPLLMGAEASGVLRDTTRPFMVYILGGALSLTGFMFTALMWFIKREHTTITGGLEKLGNTMQTNSTALSALSLVVERGFAQLQGEVSRRVLIEEHGRSSARIHEKVNKLGRTVAFLTGKLDLSPTDSESSPSERDEPEGETNT
jgi:hypothetical protein